jgi:3-phenylpropionate/trans-cinnamate dioxygenase ferredoxin subunit
MPTWINVATVDELLPGDKKVLIHQDQAIAVFNLEGKYYAIEDSCSHHALPLSEGKVFGHVVTCPFHGAQFCIKTGKALCAPARTDLLTFKTRIEARQIQIAIE